MQFSELYSYLMDGVKKLKACDSIPELRGTFIGIVYPLGLQQFSYTRFDEKGLLPEQSIYTYAEEWKEIYVSSNYHEIDPVSLKATSELEAFFWSGADHDKDDETIKDFFAKASKYGLYWGVTTPLKSAPERQAILTCSGGASSQFPASLKKQHVVVCCRVLAEIFHQCVLTIRNCDELQLKPREREILELSALGMSAAEIATVMDLSAIYIAEISRKIMHKFGTRNKLAALWRASELDLIQH